MAKKSPSNGAVLGSKIEKEAKIGEIFDRFGPEKGRYLSNPNYFLEQRSLLSGANVPDVYHKYEVLNPFIHKLNIGFHSSN